MEICVQRCTVAQYMSLPQLVNEGNGSGWRSMCNDPCATLHRCTLHLIIPQLVERRDGDLTIMAIIILNIRNIPKLSATSSKVQRALVRSTVKAGIVPTLPDSVNANSVNAFDSSRMRTFRRSEVLFRTTVSFGVA